MSSISNIQTEVVTLFLKYLETEDVVNFGLTSSAMLKNVSFAVALQTGGSRIEFYEKFWERYFVVYKDLKTQNHFALKILSFIPISESVNGLFRTAVKSGRLNLAKRFVSPNDLERLPKPSSMTIFLALYDATQLEESEVLEMLIKTESGAYLTLFLEVAIHNRDLTKVQLCLKHETIPADLVDRRKTLSRLLADAAGRGFWEAFLAIKEKYPNLENTGFYKEIAIRKSAEEGNLNIFNEYFAEIPQLNAMLLFDGFSLSAKNGHFHIASRFLQYRELIEDSRMVEVLGYAVEGKNRSLITEILKEDLPIQAYKKVEIVLVAAKNDDAETIADLLKTCKTSVEFTEFVKNAIVILRNSSEWFPNCSPTEISKMKKNLLNYAVFINHLKWVRALLAFLPFSLEERSDAIIRARQNSNQEMVAALLA